MALTAALGEALRVEGFALAGAVVLRAEGPEEALAAWRSLPADVAVLVLTARAASWLGDALRSRPDVLIAVMRE
jgi:vacuolar-type H+-ATPase subunit F/Vma7